MSGTSINGHDPDPGAWHPQDVASAWVYPGAGPTWADTSAYGAASAGGDGHPQEWPSSDRDYRQARHTRNAGPGPVLELVYVENLTASEWKPPIAGRVHSAPGALTVLYGHPGTGKGHTALGWVKRTEGRVLVLDYEANPGEWKQRAEAIELGSKRLLYLDPRGVPIPELGGELEGILAELKPAYVIVDSLLMSLGELGENEYSPQGPLSFARATEHWPCPIVGLAHESPKGGPFGSRYWTAWARMMWHLTHDPEEGRMLKLVKANQQASGERHMVHLHHDHGKLYDVQETQADVYPRG